MRGHVAYLKDPNICEPVAMIIIISDFISMYFDENTVQFFDKLKRT